jgi:hypothetical protein
MKMLLHGYSKERAIALVKQGIWKLDNKEIALQINDDMLVFGEVKIILEEGKVVDVEHIEKKNSHD